MSLAKFVAPSVTASIAIQVAVLVANIYALQLVVSPGDIILKEILLLEMIVQVIELGFYGWYRKELASSLFDVSTYRYYDWVLTTPVMLLTTMAFYVYLDYSKNASGKRTPPRFTDFIAEKWGHIKYILASNFAMLLFGFLNQMGWLSIVWSSILGFGALGGTFYGIYKYYVQHVKQPGLFIFTFLFWSLYGFAAMFSNHAKNLMFNGLDLITKNFYGVFLTWYLYTKKL